MRWSVVNSSSRNSRTGGREPRRTAERMRLHGIDFVEGDRRIGVQRFPNAARRKQLREGGAAHRVAQAPPYFPPCVDNHRAVTQEMTYRMVRMCMVGRHRRCLRIREGLERLGVEGTQHGRRTHIWCRPVGIGRAQCCTAGYICGRLLLVDFLLDRPKELIDVWKQWLSRARRVVGYRLGHRCPPM